MQCFKCLFHMDIHIDPVNAFIFVENFQDEIVNEKTFTKQTPNFFWAPSGRYQDIGHILQNPKLLWNAMGFNNLNLSHKTLKHRAL